MNIHLKVNNIIEINLLIKYDMVCLIKKKY